MIPLDDAPAAGGRRAAVREREQARQEAIVSSLRSLGTALDGEPDPAFRTATRARLVAMAAVRTPEPAPVPRSLLSRPRVLRPEPARSPVRRRLTAGLAGGALAVTALATLVAVSTEASPGDPLYDLKRGTEQTQLALSGSDRGLTLLGFAHTRLTELASLTGSGDTGLAVQTLRDMDEQTTTGAAAVGAHAVDARDPAAARRLASWGAAQSAELTGLAPRLPAGAQPAADRTAALIAQVTDRGSALATAIECSTGPAVGGFDPLGPVPLTCTTTPVGTPVQPDRSGAAGGTVDPGTVPGTTGTPANPTPAIGGTVSGPTGTSSTGGPGTGGSGTGGSVPGGSGSGGSLPRTPGGTVPTVPGLPTTGLPSTGLPRTGTGGVPVPTKTSPLPTPGSVLPTEPALPPLLPGTASTSSGSGPTTGTGLPGVSVCVPPVTIGSC